MQTKHGWGWPGWLARISTSFFHCPPSSGYKDEARRALGGEWGEIPAAYRHLLPLLPHCFVSFSSRDSRACSKQKKNIASTQDAQNLDNFKNRDYKSNRKEVSLKAGSRMNAAKIVLSLWDSWVSFVCWTDSLLLIKIYNTRFTKWSF